MAAAAQRTATGAPALNINVAFPAKLDFLLGKRARFKVAYGGRSAGRSWSFCRALLIRAITEPRFRVLCGREVQSSLRESVHQLLRDQIELMGISALFQIVENEIRGPNGSLFMFKGLSDPEAIKSMEGLDVLLLEEARTITKGTWEKVIPTVRKANSEIWIVYNPELETDFIHQTFVMNAPPPGSIVVKVNWRDNPFFPDVLRGDMEHAKATNYDDYLWIWEGHCRTALEGAVFASELRTLTAEDRITDVPYLPGKPVHTFWDLGYADHTSIWFAQIIGFRYHIIDYYENNRQLVDHYLQALQNRPYTYGTDWLPHDAASNSPGVERTVERQMRDAGRHVRIVPKVSVVDRINAGRTIMPVCVFDRQRTSAGLDRLRAWRYGLNEVKGKWTQNPVHDESSHAGDAFTYMGVALKGDTPKPKVAKQAHRSRSTGNQGWMGV